MKVMTVLGTRPEIIRLSLVIAKLDKLCDHVLVHTGQNFEAGLSDRFFEELGIRDPNYHLGVRAVSFGEQIGRILAETQRVIDAEKPDRLLILGDTNSGLAAVIAKRMGIVVYHMEAGNRCYDDRVPEEVNRRIIDHSSDIFLPYTERSRMNLLREGIANKRIFVTGNPILEVITHYEPQIQRSTVLSDLGLAPQGYVLVTMHRQENVDVKERLLGLISALDMIGGHYRLPVIVSTHPRTRKQMASLGMSGGSDRIQYLEPFGFFEFITLERNAFCVVSDSGTVQEECAIFGVPNVTIRDTTERPETIECGSNILSGAQPDSILRCVHTVVDRKLEWRAPDGYLVENVSDVVIKLLMGYYHHPMRK